MGNGNESGMVLLYEVCTQCCYSLWIQINCRENIEAKRCIPSVKPPQPQNKSIHVGLGKFTIHSFRVMQPF